MSGTKRAYLSIGSNQGEKLYNLQLAVNAIHQNAGRVVYLSSIYETTAWGFEGDDFYNACLAIDTELNPRDLLKALLAIEMDLGRIRNDAQGYQSRKIDVDIIFYEDLIVEDDNLSIPHPQLQNRRFVLEPLAEIAPGKVHPKLQKTVGELLTISTDRTAPKKINASLKNPSSSKDLSKLNYLAIEGNIGAGKTSLATKIAQDFNGKLVLERFADNPFLPKFYEDQGRYAFPLEMSFLADRYKQFSDDLAQFDLFRDFVVADYDVYKSLIFAKVTLQDDEFKLYRTIFDIMYTEMVKPDLYVYLYQNTERLLQNIRKRGRGYEQKIPSGYLEKINKGYLDHIKTKTDTNVLIIDVSEKDFVNNAPDYEELIGRISAAIL